MKWKQTSVLIGFKIGHKRNLLSSVPPLFFRCAPKKLCFTTLPPFFIINFQIMYKKRSDNNNSKRNWGWIQAGMNKAGASFQQDRNIYFKQGTYVYLRDRQFDKKKGIDDWIFFFFGKVKDEKLGNELNHYCDVVISRRRDNGPERKEWVRYILRWLHRKQRFIDYTK